MKILNLKFKNINSLSGENEIDFTTPVFTNDGLFAITGKTGAGKSSILDAISLAFYGKTPRVEIAKNDNPVMTRGEKDCYAEIVFEVAGKKWKSSWKQELNRNGNLKPVNRQIADFNDKIIADQVRACDTQIVEIIGLTFEQFTKVIMLAQGSFAAFLQANKNDKGGLLEQITGTEIYGEISINVFERNKTEKEKLAKISVELDAIKILSEAEIKNLNEENLAFEKDKKQVDEALQKIELAKKWLNDRAILQTQIYEAKHKLPELEAKTKTAADFFEKSETTLKTAKEEQTKQEPIFKKVRELDTKILEKEKSLHPILQAISELERSKNELSKTLTDQKNDLEKSKESLTEKQNWATENKLYEELVSNYSVIEKENQLLVNSLTEISNQTEEIKNLQQHLDTKKSHVKIATAVFAEKTENLSVKTKELETKKSGLAEILGGKELSEIQLEKENILNFGIQINHLIEVENAIIANQAEIRTFGEKSAQFEISNKELSEKIDTGKKSMTNLETQINLLDENIKLTQIIQSLDEHRQHLKDGEKCPLCGSLEHPFAMGNVPQIGEKEKESTILKNRLQDILKAIQQNEKNLVALVSNHENDSNNKAKEEKSLSDNSEKQKEILTKIKSINSNFSIPEGDQKMERLNEILIQKRDELKKVTALIKQATDTEAQLVNLRDREIPILQNDKTAAEQTKNEAEIAQKLAEQQLNDKQSSVAIAQEKYNKEYAEFLKKLNTYAVDNIEALKKCLDAWNDNKKRTDDLTNQITTITGNIALNNKELDSQIKSFSEKQKEKQDLETDKQKLSDERKEVFAEKSVEDEENRLKKWVEDAETVKKSAEKEKNNTHTELEKNKAVIIEREKEFAEKQEQKITEKTNEELQTEFDEKKIKSDGFSQKIGANNQILELNTENLKSNSIKLKEKEKQQAICSRWGRLNELIGSSDGQKYRNFAQALTFEHLIGLANKQLNKMSDRYILKCTGDTSNPFELSVIDKFQNSEERTAQNLSGGEKFIVSLSLALGLANMASKNMRIDTMFIDEGFGTLDADYLDVALNALSNLQSEGKIIGVISHLTELKERIATHVEVIPSGNGHSKIQITN